MDFYEQGQMAFNICGWLLFHALLPKLFHTHTALVQLLKMDIQGGPKIWHGFCWTLSNINRFSKFFHCQNQKKICNDIITNDPTTPQVCRYNTLWNVSVLKATIVVLDKATDHSTISDHCHSVMCHPFCTFINQILRTVNTFCSIQQ